MADARRWPALKGPAGRSAEPGAAEAQSSVAAGARLPALQQHLEVRELRVAPQPGLELKAPQLGAQLPSALQAAEEIELAALLPACGPEPLSTHRRAWRCSTGQSWGDFPPHFEMLPTLRNPQNENHARSDSEHARLHSLQWSWNGFCLLRDPLPPERRESAYF